MTWVHMSTLAISAPRCIHHIGAQFEALSIEYSQPPCEKSKLLNLDGWFKESSMVVSLETASKLQRSQCQVPMRELYLRQARLHTPSLQEKYFFHFHCHEHQYTFHSPPAVRLLHLPCYPRNSYTWQEDRSRNMSELRRAQLTRTRLKPNRPP